MTKPQIPGQLSLFDDQPEDLDQATDQAEQLPSGGDSVISWRQIQ